MVPGAGSRHAGEARLGAPIGWRRCPSGPRGPAIGWWGRSSRSPNEWGEPEAGSEFAIGAAAAGEVRRGARVSGSQCVILGGQSESGPSARSFSFCPPIPYPCQIHRGPEAKECSRQQRVNTPFRTQEIVLLGSSIGRGGGGWKLIPSKRGLCGVYSGLGDTWIPTGQ